LVKLTTGVPFGVTINVLPLSSFGTKGTARHLPIARVASQQDNKRISTPQELSLTVNLERNRGALADVLLIMRVLVFLKATQAYSKTLPHTHGLGPAAWK